MGIQEFVNKKLVRFGKIEAPPTVSKSASTNGKS